MAAFTSFKQPTYQQALAKKKASQKRAISRKNASTPKKALKKSVGAKNGPKKTIPKGYKTPPWFNAIPRGSHGSNPAQKRYWKVVSDLVRQRDFKKYRGKCVTCPRRLERWEDGQAAHYKAWSVCNGYFKYELTNLALSCSHCNHINDGTIGTAFGEELKRRHGEQHLDWIEKENARHRGEKMENWEIVERVEKLLEENPDFICP